MTFREKLVQNGEKFGLFRDDSEKILSELIKEGGFNRWDNDIEGYPPMMVSVLWISFKRKAGKWLSVNNPMHWAIDYFNGKEK